MRFFTLLIIILSSSFISAYSNNYHIGPGMEYDKIADAPWNALSPGDTVFIHWKDTPYKEKWVVNLRGQEGAPIVVSGVANMDGELPKIDGNNAETPQNLDFWNENRGVIKVGGASAPNTDMPSDIVIENLDIHSGRPPYKFTDDQGLEQDYNNNCAAVFIEKGERITVRHCILRDCGNGLFASRAASDILIEYNHIYDNGIEDRYYEHNNYTEAAGIIFQFNHFGPLREGCDGNNLKDRSKGTVIRYNWIEDGNRQLDLVNTGSEDFFNDPSYHETFVYGNILVEGEGQGNSQIIHYGGDSEDQSLYRKGTLYLYNNTIISKRSGNATMVRLSTSEEKCVCVNNIIYTIADGSKFAILNDKGEITMKNNFIKPGWVVSHGSYDGTVNDLGNLEAASPGFTDFEAMTLTLREKSPCIDAGALLEEAYFQDYMPEFEYVKHMESQERNENGIIDIGAYEAPMSESVELEADDEIISASPNPIKDRCRIRCPEAGRIIIYNLFGEIVLDKNNSGSEFLWEPAAELPNGVYFARVITGETSRTIKLQMMR